MKKVLAIALPILIIAAGIFLLYKFVLMDIMDPPPEKVMENLLDAAQEFVTNHTETNEESFIENFSNRSREGLDREWRALSLDGSRRGSWYEMAANILNADGSRPEVLGEEPSGGEEEAEEGEEEEEEDVTSNVRIRQDREERLIPFIREEGHWRIDIPTQPTPWTTRPAEGG
jgi:hypothetical protein